MRIRTRFKAAFGVVALIGVGTFAANKQKHKVEVGGLRCDWRPDYLAQYHLKTGSMGEIYEGVLNGTPNQPPQRVVMQYEADFLLGTASQDDGLNTYGVSLSAIRGFEDRAADLQKDLARPFYFRMDAGCRFVEFGFAAEEGRESRDLKKGLLVVMEVAARQPQTVLEKVREKVLLKKPQLAWRTTQTDASGDFVASYHQHVEKGRITRNKLYYSAVAPLSEVVPLDIKIEKSEASFEPKHDFWVAKLHAQEAMRMVTKTGQPFIHSTADVSLELAEGQLNSPIAKTTKFGNTSDMRAIVWEGLRIEQKTVMKTSDYTSIGSTTSASSAGTLSNALKNFANGKFQNGRLDHEAIGDLVHFLRAHPEAIGDLLAKVKAGEVPAELQAFVFFALQKTGTPEVQHALIGVVADVEHTEMNRMLAIHALADVQTPIPEALETLVATSNTFADHADENHTLASTAILALGILDRQQASGPLKELAKAASDELVSKMNSNVSEQERAVLAEALGNTGDPKHEQLIVEQFANDSPIVRVAAARGLARLDSPNADKALLDVVGREKIVDARKSIAEAWATKGGSAGTFDTAKLGDIMAREADADVRLALISVMGREAAKQPAAKAALINQYAKETSPRLKYKIGTFLKADDLL